MKVAILVGELGSPLSEETERKPKPMVEIGGRPDLCANAPAWDSIAGELEALYAACISRPAAVIAGASA